MMLSRLRDLTLFLTAALYALGHSYVGAMLLAIVFAAEVLTGAPAWPRTVFDRSLGVLVGALALSGALSEWRGQSLVATAQFAVGAPIVIRGVMLSVGRTPGFARRLLGTLAFAGAAAGALAAYFIAATPYHRAQGHVLGPNIFGTVMAVTLVALLGLSIEARRASRALCLLAIAPTAYALLLTWSRGAWAAAAVGIAVLAALTPWRRLVPGVAVLVAVLAVSSVVVGPQYRAHAQRFNQTLETGDPISRPFIWRVAARIFIDHPWVGTGFSTFSQVYRRYDQSVPEGPPAHAHNLLLQLAVETGILGLAAFTAFASVCAAALLGWRAHARTPAARALPTTVIALAVTLFAHQMVDLTLFGSSMIIALYVLCGLAAAGRSCEF